MLVKPPPPPPSPPTYGKSSVIFLLSKNDFWLILRLFNFFPLKVQKYLENFHDLWGVSGGGSTHIWKIPYVPSFLFLKALWKVMLKVLLILWSPSLRYFSGFPCEKDFWGVGWIAIMESACGASLATWDGAEFEISWEVVDVDMAWTRAWQLYF